MAVVTVALRQRTTTAVLRVRDDVIVMQTMMWPDEIRQPDFNVEAGEVKPAEVKMATMLVETLAGDFDPSEFEDDYAEAVESLVKTKIEGGEIKRTPTSTKSSGEVVDLLAALQRSVDAAKTARGEDTGDDEDEGQEPAKKAATEVDGEKACSQEGRQERSVTEESSKKGQLDCRGLPFPWGRETTSMSSFPAEPDQRARPTARDAGRSCWSRRSAR